MGTFKYAHMYLYIWLFSPYGLRRAIFLRIIISNCAPRVVPHGEHTIRMFRYKIEITIVAMCFREPSRMNVQHYAPNLKIGVLHPRAEDICISHRKRYKVVSVLGTNARRRTFGKHSFLTRPYTSFTSFTQLSDEFRLFRRILTSTDLSSSLFTRESSIRCRQLRVN